MDETGPARSLPFLQALAEEILQDTMFAVWRGAGSFRGESSVRSWVIAVARRSAGDRDHGAVHGGEHVRAIAE
jgi:DNA-directed RNA polymerase specialized sigma24 family protein